MGLIVQGDGIGIAAGQDGFRDVLHNFFKGSRLHLVPFFRGKRGWKRPEYDRMRALNAALASIAIMAGVGVSSLVQAQGEAQFAITPDKLKWSPSPVSPSENATVFGDPRKPGPFVTRVRLKPNMKVMPHSHPIDVQLTVLSGTLLFAEGETFDEAKLKEFPAGSFVFERANVPHYLLAKTDVVFQTTGNGPNAFTFVNPKDDPRKK